MVSNLVGARLSKDANPMETKRTRDYVRALLVIPFSHHVSSPTSLVVLVGILFWTLVPVVSLLTTSMAHHGHWLQVGASGLTVSGLVPSSLTSPTPSVTRSIVM